jgi:hypothetical protein
MTKSSPKLRISTFLLMVLVGLIVSGSVSAIWARLADSPNRAKALPNATNPHKDENGWPIGQTNTSNTEVWECEVVIVGGSLSGVAAAYHSMQTGARTCLIELTPMLGGQVSSQGVSAIDESLLMRGHQVFSTSWTRFKNTIADQIALPSALTHLKPGALVAQTNSCWVGTLCFSPTAGATASDFMLKEAAIFAPGSRWGTEIAFKGADFNRSGDRILAIHAVRRKARDPNYIPKGRLSQEIASWYRWQSDSVFIKTPIKLQPPPGKDMIAIDATDTGELVGWANIPHRLGTEGFATTGELHAVADNSDCTQAFTFPFVLAVDDDQGQSLKRLKQVQPGLSKQEHREDYSLGRYPMFGGSSLFNYRRIFSMVRNDPFKSYPSSGDMTVVNWNKGNDWGVMNPPLIMNQQEIEASGQRQDWLGGLNLAALKEGENHALLFSEWLIEKYATSNFPLVHLSGKGMPIPTESGLSMYPYIREGRRILGRPARDQEQFFLREQDIRKDIPGWRDFRKSAIGITHYAIDMHGCRYRNWEPSRSSSSAPVSEESIRPIFIPLESLIPQKIDNLLIGGKGIAVTHIVIASTRIHVGEWATGAAAGATAAWILQQGDPSLTPQGIINRGMLPRLQQHLSSQGISLQW